jgi:hypothetical protein
MAKNIIFPAIRKRLPVIKRLSTSSISEHSDYDKLMWEQTGGKHHPEYYNSLKTAFAQAAFCGELIPGSPHDPAFYLQGGNKAKAARLFYSILTRKRRIIQWDSWRFWESLCAGCIPIHLDLEKYGVQLPEMPENWEHYVGLDLDNLDRDIERLCFDPTVTTIGDKGKNWAMTKYSQKASAGRLVQLIK